MKLVETDDAFEIHISSAVTDNYVVSNHKKYIYKRLIIPSLIVDYFSEKKANSKYVYLYFVDDHVFLSNEKLSDYKFSRRKLMKIQKKNSFFINLNMNSLAKHDIMINNTVLFRIYHNSSLNFSSNICVELIF